MSNLEDRYPKQATAHRTCRNSAQTIGLRCPESVFEGEQASRRVDIKHTRQSGAEASILISNFTEEGLTEVRFLVEERAYRRSRRFGKS
jgi:hypothetical protein